MNSKKIIIFTLSLLFGIASSSQVLAEITDKKNDDTKSDFNDYDSNFYEDEGRIIFKIKGHYILSKGNQSDFTKPFGTKGESDPKNNQHLVDNGFGGEISTGIFFHDNFAAEFSLGIDSYKVNQDAIKTIGHNYFKSYTNPNPDFDPNKPISDSNPRSIEVSNPPSLKDKNLIGMPLSLVLQYHIAPFGAIRPYIGAGGHYTYFFQKSKEFEVRPGYGFLGMVGLDFVFKDDNMVSFSVKKLALNPKVLYKSRILGNSTTNNSVFGKVKLDPVILSVGWSYKF